MMLFDHQMGLVFEIFAGASFEIQIAGREAREVKKKFILVGL